MGHARRRQGLASPQSRGSTQVQPVRIPDRLNSSALADCPSCTARLRGRHWPHDHRRPYPLRRSHRGPPTPRRSEEHTSELQSLMRNSYAVFCLKKKKSTNTSQTTIHNHIEEKEKPKIQ